MTAPAAGAAPRTVVAIGRTVIYAGLAALLFLRPGGPHPLLDAAILGAVLADYLTWFLWSIARLPDDLLHGGYEAVLNAFFGWLMFRSVHLSPGDDGTELALAFVTFMLVVGAKTLWFGVEHVAESLRQD